MQDGVSSTIEQKKLKPLSWTLDITTQEFNLYSEESGQNLFPNLTLDKFDDWLALMSPEHRHDIELFLESVCQDGGKRSCVIALWEDEKHGLYVVFSSEKLSQYILQGDIQPIFEIDQGQQSMEWFDFMLRQNNSGLLMTSSDSRVVGCNKSFEVLSGFGLAEVLGLNSTLLFAENHNFLDEERLSSSGSLSIKHASGDLRHCSTTSLSLSFLNHPDIFLSLFSLRPREDHVSIATILTKKAFADQLEAIYQRQIDNSIYVVITLNIKNSTGQLQETFSDVMSRLKVSRLFGKIKDNLYLTCIKCSVPSGEKPHRYLHRQIKNFFHELKMLHSEVYQYCAEGKIGISVLGVDASNAKMAVTHSVQALLEQQTDVVNHIRFFDSELHRQIKKRRLLEALITECVEKQKVGVKYQPILDTQTWQVIGYEALLDLPLPPALPFTRVELESVIQDLDLAAELDVMVQEKAIQQLTWLQSYHSSPIRLTLNAISQYESKTFVDVLYCLVRLMRDNKVSPHQFNIQAKSEALASIATQDIDMWQQLGIKFIADDVKLDNLLSVDLPVGRYDKLKLAPSYLDTLSKEKMVSKAIKMLLEECHCVNVAVTMDQVNTSHDAELLAYLGVDCVQGDYFSRPVALDDVPLMLEKIEQVIPSLFTLDVVNKDETLQGLCFSKLPCLDPGDFMSLAYRYFQSADIDIIPVVNHHECVGFIDRASLNLHLTPHMGTDIENTKETSMWHRPVNQIMQLSFTKLDARTDISRIKTLIGEEHLPFPWILVDGKKFKGVLTQHSVLQHLVESRAKPTT